MRRFIKTFKNSIYGKILSFLFKLAIWALEILIIFLAIVIVVPRFTNNEETFLGYRIFNVATGSMEPEYAVGDILISKEKDPSEIKVGENIVYLGAEGGYEGKIITHNIIGIQQNEKGEYLFRTKGRANTVEDPIVHEDQIYGTIVHNNPVLAWICKVLTNRYGLYFFVIMPIVLSAFIEFVKVQGRKAEEEREQRRLAQQKRKGKKKSKRPERIVEEIPEEEIIEEEVIEIKKKTKSSAKKNGKKEIVEEQPKKKSTTSKSKKVEETLEESEPEEKVVTKKKTSSKKKEEPVDDVKKTPRKKSQVKEENAEDVNTREAEQTKKTTRKKQAKDK